MSIAGMGTRWVKMMSEETTVCLGNDCRARVQGVLEQREEGGKQ